MFDYGRAPAADEVELTVFGPGYGEAISVHMGDGIWLLVDSCMAPNKLPASLNYLDILGVPHTQVQTIVASHWHDDHVKGLTEMVKSCTNATLHISSVFNDKEALAFLSAYGGSAVATHSAGAKELFNAISSSPPNSICATTHKTLIWEGEIQGRKMRAAAFSPTQAAHTQSIARMAQLIPGVNDPIKHVVELKPNLEAIVINIDLGGDAILLGSDLEDHNALGWSSIVSDKWCLSNQCASVYKIAHHGSSTGDHPEIWSKLLSDEPVASLTPFIKGKVKLPKPTDEKRIVANTKQAFLSSDGSKKAQINSDLIKRMGQLAKNITPINSGFGAVRFRRKLEDKEWSVQLFGQARSLI